MKWKTVEGYQEERPKEIDLTSSLKTVYIRKNIRSVPNVDPEGGEATGTHWKYDEAQMTFAEFETYSKDEIFNRLSAMDETMAEILLNQLEV